MAEVTSLKLIELDGYITAGRALPDYKNSPIEVFIEVIDELRIEILRQIEENAQLRARIEKLEKFCENHAFSLTLNANDTFYYASADATEVDSMDVEKLLEVYQLFGDWGVTAFQAHLRNEIPIGKLADEYYKARDYLKDFIPFGLKSCEETDDKKVSEL